MRDKFQFFLTASRCIAEQKNAITTRNRIDVLCIGRKGSKICQELNRVLSGIPELCPDISCLLLDIVRCHFIQHAQFKMLSAEIIR